MTNPLAAPSADRDDASTPVIPDCCNMGIVLRSLLAVNAAAALVAICAMPDFITAASAFATGAPAVELSSMLSLLMLCTVRLRLAESPRWSQMAACVLLPAIVAAAVSWLLGVALDAFHVNLKQSALLGAVAGAALLHYFSLRRQAHSPALAQARLQALQARIRPHFLFNSLNAVLALIRTRPRNAEMALEDLSDLLRVLLRDAREMATLEEELQLCRQYLAIESLRLGERLQLAWDLSGLDEDSLRTARVPSLILQPLLENAVHHGVEPSMEAVLIKIALRRSADRIEAEISNPVHRAAPRAGHQMALSNIRERLSLLYDLEAELATATEHDEFTVRLRLPFQKSAA